MNVLRLLWLHYHPQYCFHVIVTFGLFRWSDALLCFFGLLWGPLYFMLDDLSISAGLPFCFSFLRNVLLFMHIILELVFFRACCNSTDERFFYICGFAMASWASTARSTFFFFGTRVCLIGLLDYCLLLLSV